MDAYTRRVSTSLQALAHLISEAVAAAGGGGVGTAAQSSALAALGGQLTEQLLDAKFWRLGAAKATPVRCAVYTFSFTLLQRLPDLVMEMAEPLATALLDGLSDREPTAHAALWDPLLLLLRSHPTALQASTAGKHILPRLLSLLRNGCFGAATTVSPALLPFASPCRRTSAPSGGGPAPRLTLGAIWEGLRSDSLPAAHFRALHGARRAAPTARRQGIRLSHRFKELPRWVSARHSLSFSKVSCLRVSRTRWRSIASVRQSSRWLPPPAALMPPTPTASTCGQLPARLPSTHLRWPGCSTRSLPRHQPPHCAAPPASARLHDGGVECRGVYGMRCTVGALTLTPHACGAAC